MLSINAKTRNIKEELLKDEIKAVFYGPLVATTSISINSIEFLKVWQKAGENTAIKLILDKKEMDVMIHEVQLHPILNKPMHVDFLVIDMNKKVEVSVPIVFSGISEAVKSGIGVLVKVLREVDIEALPKDIPHNIEVDISKLVDLDSVILAKELILPKGITLITKEDEVVASIAEQKEEKEEVAPVDLSSIEVEKKGKKEEEKTE